MGGAYWVVLIVGGALERYAASTSRWSSVLIGPDWGSSSASGPSGVFQNDVAEKKRPQAGGSSCRAAVVTRGLVKPRLVNLTTRLATGQPASAVRTPGASAKCRLRGFPRRSVSVRAADSGTDRAP